MIGAEQAVLLLILLIGVILVLAILVKAGLERIGVPALVGYIVLGLLLRSVNQTWQVLSTQEQEVLKLLADIGIISLLFRVGLESKLEELLQQLRRASTIWVGDVLVSSLLGFFTAYSLLKLGLIPSLFVSIAMTATSVGISVSLWQEANAIQSPNGELMLDVAEMDDISAVVLMALLFSVAPALRGEPEAAILPTLAQTTGVFIFKATIFGASCFFFSRYAEKSITQFFRRIEPPPDPTIVVAGFGFITAAIAGLLGFSVAIGAFFAGLIFSRDPQAVKLDASFDTFYEVFVPFFFIGIGFQVDLSMLPGAFGLGIALLIAAVLGKMIGVAVPALAIASGWTSATLLGVSMVPRAEITMIVMQRGLQLGEWALPSQVFAAMVLVSTATIIIVPLVLRPLLQKWPQTEEP